jgi:hypothetical protein
MSDAKHALALLDVANRLYGPAPNPLDDPALRYRMEPTGSERWLTWPVAQEEGREGKPLDCEDIASWYGASVGGRGYIYRAGPTLLHVVTKKGGRLYDASRNLGMP